MSNLVKDSDTTNEVSLLSLSAEPSAENAEGSSGDAINYSTMTTTELKALCKERGLTGYSNLTKTELIDLLCGE